MPIGRLKRNERATQFRVWIISLFLSLTPLTAKHCLLYTICRSIDSSSIRDNDHERIELE